MAAFSERDAGIQVGRTIILTLLGVLFAGALYMSARQGVSLAMERLSAGEGTVERHNSPE